MNRKLVLLMTDFEIVINEERAEKSKKAGNRLAMQRYTNSSSFARFAQETAKSEKQL